MTKQTPIRAVIKSMLDNWTEEEIQKDNWLKTIYDELQWQLPKEKKLIDEVWDEASGSAYDCRRVHGTSEWDKKQHAANKDEFLSQYYPELKTEVK